MPKATAASSAINGTPLTPGHLMGLPCLLRAWRDAAGQRKGLGRQLTQEEVARAIGRSVRWYSDLEHGATRRLDRPTMDSLADVLMLGRDERQALHLYAVGGAVPAAPTPRSDHPDLQDLNLLVNQLMPSPAYLCDANWNIISHNSTMAEWWPWVLESDANLMRWALLSSEARQQYIDWLLHAADYLALLRFAALQRPQDCQLAELLAEILEDPECRRIWESGTDVAETRDNHHYWLSLPRHHYEIVEVVSHVLYPGSLPACRLVVVTWLQGPTDPQSTVAISAAKQPPVPAGATQNAPGRLAVSESDERRAQDECPTASRDSGRQKFTTDGAPSPEPRREKLDDWTISGSSPTP